VHYVIFYRDIIIYIVHDLMVMLAYQSFSKLRTTFTKEIIYKTKSQNLSFNLSGNKIVCEDNVKLLGVTIDSDLNFDNHISEILFLFAKYSMMVIWIFEVNLHKKNHSFHK
jgi:hypothetical protein